MIRIINLKLNGEDITTLSDNNPSRILLELGHESPEQDILQMEIDDEIYLFRLKDVSMHLAIARDNESEE
jgi:hypothetical protein